jgi:hypothetical protein
MTKTVGLVIKDRQEWRPQTVVGKVKRFSHPFNPNGELRVRAQAAALYKLVTSRRDRLPDQTCYWSRWTHLLHTSGKESWARLIRQSLRRHGCSSPRLSLSPGVSVSSRSRLLTDRPGLIGFPAVVPGIRGLAYQREGRLIT